MLGNLLFWPVLPNVAERGKTHACPRQKTTREPCVLVVVWGAGVGGAGPQRRGLGLPLGRGGYEFVRPLFKRKQLFSVLSESLFKSFRFAI